MNSLLLTVALFVAGVACAATQHPVPRAHPHAARCTDAHPPAPAPTTRVAAIKAVGAFGSDLGRCYDQALQERDAAGHVFVELRAEPNGRVDAACIRATEIRDEGALACMLNVMQKVQLAPTDAVATIVIPLNFIPPPPPIVPEKLTKALLTSFDDVARQIVRAECWQPALNTRSDMIPDVLPLWTNIEVKPDGRVGEVRVAGAPPGLGPIAECVRIALHELLMPVTLKGGTLRVKFVLRTP